MKLQGIFADLPTPFDYKGDIYPAKIQHNVEKWNLTTLAGYVVCGAAGESDSLTAEERIAVLELVSKYAAPEKLLVASVGGVEASEAVRLGYRAVPAPQLVTSPATLWESLSGGASGAVLALASAIPYAMITIWEAFRTREEEAGRDWQQRIAPAAAAVERFGVPGLKYAMDLNGYYGGPPRLPLVVPSSAVKRGIEASFRGLKG